MLKRLLKHYKCWWMLETVYLWFVHTILFYGDWIFHCLLPSPGQSADRWNKCSDGQIKNDSRSKHESSSYQIYFVESNPGSDQCKCIQQQPCKTSVIFSLVIKYSTPATNFFRGVNLAGGCGPSEPHAKRTVSSHPLPALTTRPRDPVTWRLPLSLPCSGPWSYTNIASLDLLRYIDTQSTVFIVPSYILYIVYDIFYVLYFIWTLNTSQFPSKSNPTWQ